MNSSTSTILLLIAIGVAYTFVMPQYSEVQNLKLEASEYQAVLDNVEAISETSDMLSDKYRDIPTEEIERLSKILPDNIDTVRLALDLDTMASQYGIAIDEVVVDQNASNNSGVIEINSGNLPYDKATISFGFVSNYQSFKALLADMEQSLRIINVKSISFAPGDDNLYEHTIYIETYWLK